MGLAISDAQYFNDLPYPGMLDLPPELKQKAFLDLLEDDTSPGYTDRALNFIDALNASIPEKKMKWNAFVYRSQHLPTADGSDALGRFFVEVPRREYTQFIQFGLRHDLKLPRVRSVSIVTRVADQAWLNDLWRIRRSDGSIVLSSRLAESGTLENCYLCHKTPLLSIVPDPLFFDAKRFGEALRRANRSMDAQRPLRHAHLPAAAYGPSLGPVEGPYRTEAFLKSCAGDQIKDPQRLARLAQVMACADCHNGDRRGALNYPSARFFELPLGGTLVDRYVVTHQRMPPAGTDLSLPERRALVECLRHEYYDDFEGKPGILKTWLQNDGCWSGPSL